MMLAGVNVIPRLFAGPRNLLLPRRKVDSALAIGMTASPRRDKASREPARELG